METDVFNTFNYNECDILNQDTNGPQETSENALASYEYPCLFKSKILLELSNSSWSRSVSAKDDIQPYLRGCKWSPDGTCCLTVVNNDGVHVTELPKDLYSGPVSSNRMINVLDSIIHVKETGLIYDFCWYPGMNSAMPETCCWLTTRQNGPIQMWDAFDGSLRCTYRGFNAVDEMEPALSLTFTTDASKIIAGYKKVLRTFDVQRPGREFAEHKISSPASCLATNGSLLACGSWNRSISLYSTNDMGTYKSIGKMYGHERGVTHIKFTPDGLKLVSGARKDHRLLVWDIRHYRQPINILHRVADTNQRIYFDISPCGKFIVSGGTDGVVRVWDRDQKTDDATYKFQLHNDCCNSISMHPYRQILATGSGQYHFKDPTSFREELHSRKQSIGSTNEEDVLSDQSINKIDMIRDCLINSDDDRNVSNAGSLSEDKCEMKYSTISENSLIFWWLGDLDLT